MTLMRWSPWQELEHMNRQLSRLLDDSYAGFAGDKGAWIPSVDIHETDEAMLLQAELPGIEKKDVSIEVNNGILTVTGERRFEKDVNKKHMHSIERSYGRFSRSFNLPRYVDSSHIDASMKNGVLEIRLPKVEAHHDSTKVNIH